jgi:hypothetical protein
MWWGRVGNREVSVGGIIQTEGFEGAERPISGRNAKGLYYICIFAETSYMLVSF